MKKYLITGIAGLLLILFAMTVSAIDEADGILVWAKKAELSLPVSGIISSVNAKPGDRIKVGEVMLRLDTRRAKANLNAARARVSQTEPGREEAQRELERAEELFDRTVLSQVELDKAMIDFAEKDALYHEARANVEQARLDIEYSELRAPFDLSVLATHVVKGQTIVNRLQASPLFTVAGNEVMARLVLKPAQVTDLSIGQAVNVSIQGQSNSGRVQVMNYDENQSAVIVHISLPDTNGVIAGQSVHVTWQ